MVIVTFCCWRKPEYPEKTTDLPQITLSHNVVLNTPRLNRIRAIKKGGGDIDALAASFSYLCFKNNNSTLNPI